MKVRRQHPQAVQLLTILLTVAFAPTPTIAAEKPQSPAAQPVGSVVVTARKRAIQIPDEVLTVNVARALEEHPYFYGEHVTVECRDGVVHLRGAVLDEWDLRIALRLARRLPGVRRVVNELEILSGGSD